MQAQERPATFIFTLTSGLWITHAAKFIKSRLKLAFENLLSTEKDQNTKMCQSQQSDIVASITKHRLKCSFAATCENFREDRTGVF